MTIAVALLVLISCPFWQGWTAQFTAWRLTRQLHDANASTRRAAAAGLVQLGPTATSWVIGAMRDLDPRVRQEACSVVVYTVPERPDAVLAALLAATKDSVPAVRASAVAQLETLISRYGSGVDAEIRERALRGLSESLGDESPQVRRAAVDSFLMLGPKAKASASESSIETLHGSDKSLSIRAAEAMLRIDREATHARAIAALSALLTDQSMQMEHLQVVQVLVRAQGEELTAAVLIPILKNKDRATRMLAQYELVEFCSSARALKPAMIEVLANPDGGMREEAAVYFLKTEPKMAGPGLKRSHNR